MALLTQTEAARRLGLSQGFLSRLGRQHPFYTPDTDGIPGVTSSGRNFRRYHSRHVELIEAVLVQGMDIMEADAEWRTARTRMGRKVQPQRRDH